MTAKNLICCLDLEGVLIPEIWIQVSEKTKIKELRLTTRDVPDYEVLMRRRIKILKQHGIKLRVIQNVIATIKPLKGAKPFLDELRRRHQTLILSDTFYEFAMPIMRRFGYPPIFCNWLESDARNHVTGYRLRQTNGKEKAVKKLKEMGFRVHAAGDSYNDIRMLKAAHRGVFFNPPTTIANAYPEFKIAANYRELLKHLDDKAN